VSQRISDYNFVELSDCSPNIQVIKSRRIRWAGHVARVGDRKGTYGVLVGYIREIDHLEDLGVDRRIISEWVIEKGVWEAWTVLLWLRLGTGGGSL
jgi:hypothetical protein